MDHDRAYVVGERLLHPVFIGSVAVLVLNDHVLKRAWPGLLTGKLSDLAGLCFFPVLLLTLLEITTRRRPLGYGWLVACALATALVFSLVKTWGPAAEAYRYGVGALQWTIANLFRLGGGGGIAPLRRVQIARDPTDLLALPMACVAPWMERRRRVSLGAA